MGRATGLGMTRFWSAFRIKQQYKIPLFIVRHTFLKQGNSAVTGLQASILS